MPYHREIGELVEIGRIGEEELLVEWRIQDVSLLPGGSFDCYFSYDFIFGDGIWYLSMWPIWQGEIQNPASGWVGLGICRLGGCLPKKFRFFVGIKGFGGLEISREGVKEFSGNDDHRWDDFCLRSDLIEHKSRLMPNGILSIMCFLKRCGAVREQSSNECVICYVKPIDCALYCCGHMCMCYKCAFIFWKSNSSAKCPICRDSIRDVLKIYK